MHKRHVKAASPDRNAQEKPGYTPSVAKKGSQPKAKVQSVLTARVPTPKTSDSTSESSGKSIAALIEQPQQECIAIPDSTPIVGSAEVEKEVVGTTSEGVAPARTHMEMDTEALSVSEKAAGTCEIVDPKYKIPKKKGKQPVPGPDPFKYRTFAEIVHTYSLGQFVIARDKIAQGPNSRIMTDAGIQVIVDSIKSQGFVQGSLPIICSVLSDTKYRDAEKVKNNPDLLQEVLANRFIYDAGSHRELACQYLEQHADEIPPGVEIPKEFLCEVLVSLEPYDYMVLGKKSNEVSHAVNKEKICDLTNQIARTYARVNQIYGGRKNASQADAYRLWQADFSPMGTTKFNKYWAFGQLLQEDGRDVLVACTQAAQGDFFGFNIIEAMVTTLNASAYKGMDFLKHSVALFSLHFLLRYFQANNKFLASTLYQTWLPYAIMIMSFKRTCMSLCDNKLPKAIEDYFVNKTDKLDIKDASFLECQEFYALHHPHFSENSAYIPLEVKKHLVIVQEGIRSPAKKRGTQTSASPTKTPRKKARTSRTPDSALQSTLSPPTKRSARIANMKGLQMEPVVSDNDTISEEEQVVEEEHVFDVEQDLDEQNQDTVNTGWTRPSAEDLESVRTFWLSGELTIPPTSTPEKQQPCDLENEWLIVCNSGFDRTNPQDLPRAAFISCDWRDEGASLTEEQIVNLLQVFSSSLLLNGVLVMALDLSEVTKQCMFNFLWNCCQ